MLQNVRKESLPLRRKDTKKHEDNFKHRLHIFFEKKLCETLYLCVLVAKKNEENKSIA